METAVCVCVCVCVCACVCVCVRVCVCVCVRVEWGGGLSIKEARLSLYEIRVLLNTSLFTPRYKTDTLEMLTPSSKASSSVPFGKYSYTRAFSLGVL